MSDNESTVTNVGDLINALDNGFLGDTVGAWLSEIALQTCELHEETLGKSKGSVILKIDVSTLCPVEGTLHVSHDFKQVLPTKGGGEDTSRKKGRSLMHMQRGGKIVETQPPENLRGQGRMNFDD